MENKKYKIIYADPPWSYQDKKCNGNTSDHYQTQSVEWIKRLGGA
jgi:site-specific DNA-methyltransferase (adenine-specific)